MSKPFIIVCGKPKLGKSTEALKSFQNSLAILSSENNVHYYKKLLGGKLKDVRLPNGELKYRPPKRTKLIDVQMVGSSAEYEWLKPGDAKAIRASYRKDEKGQLIVDDFGSPILAPDPNGDRVMPVNQLNELEKTLITVVTASQMAIDKGEKPKYDNLIIDEWGEFMDRVHSEITPTCRTKKDEIDTRGAFLMTTEWMQKVVNWMKQLIVCGVGVCLVMHDREPDGKKTGGPKAPSAGMSRKMVAMCDGAVQRVMKDPEPGARNEDGSKPKPMRLWRASATEEWDIGLRGLEPEDEDVIGPMELEEVIKLAGYDMHS